MSETITDFVENPNSNLDEINLGEEHLYSREYNSLIEKLDGPWHKPVWGTPLRVSNTGQRFVCKVYEHLKENGQRTDFNTILLTASIFVNRDDTVVKYGNRDYVIQRNHEYFGRIVLYLNQVTITAKEQFPEYYTDELMTTEWNEENLQ